MSGLRSDMSGLGRICLIKLDLTLQKNRSGAKTMNLGPYDLQAKHNRA
jgi:hypothetical protein